ncbi:type III-B CRISPR module RAMP protein Cmr6 [Runella sp. MFBS21]|uniref:type III-B CRISPR module RAMP protein Cmr6 n=1 Tax=Runella sp. MFBS21 TaxID=3034018 RepID=UPI0023F7461D|nr:type III-B CRISPR module RAMP protein Cmr6 [Runella sp. MFBS21]MDF7818110.1 type III-B CRISPR module RAMP protein Cmr6 [Runella sp. MFBS21]
MKKGIFIILNDNGKLVAGIKRADGQVIRIPELEVNPDIQELDGMPCEYFKKEILIIDDENIYQKKYIPKEDLKQEVKSPSLDFKSQLNQVMNAKDTEDESMENKTRAKLSQDSFSLKDSKVPSDVRQIKISDIDNFYLKLNKFSRWTVNEKGENKFLFFNAQERKNKQKNVTLGKFEIKENFGILENKFAALNKRHHNNAKALFGESVVELTLTPSYHLVVGLGGHSVYETSMTLHHIYGVPYIPANSIKGVLRSWIILDMFDNKESSALEDDTFVKWFGSQSSAGKLVFFDAFPNEKPRIEPDIMNVHYPDYYQGSKPPTDTQSPIPIYFLTVTESPFKFFIGSSELNTKNAKLKDKTIEDWLKDALTNHGIGAKTAVGYGYFHEPPV